MYIQKRKGNPSILLTIVNKPQERTEKEERKTKHLQKQI